MVKKKARLTGEVNFLEIGAHLDDAAPVETMRYIGPKSKLQLNAIGILTVGDLKRTGVIDTYLTLKQTARYQVNINFVWAMFAGLLGVDFNKIPQEFKEVVRAELKASGS